MESIYFRSTYTWHHTLLSFWSWLIALFIMCSRFINVFKTGAFFWDSVVFHCVYVLYFLYPFINRQLTCFCILATVHNAEICITVQMSLCHSNFNFLEYTSRGEIAYIYLGNETESHASVFWGEKTERDKLCFLELNSDKGKKKAQVRRPQKNIFEIWSLYACLNQNMSSMFMNWGEGYIKEKF